MMWIVLFVLALLSSGIGFIFSWGSLSSFKVVEILLGNLLLYSVGISGFLAFYGHAFMADKVARGIGWEPGSPFQYEVAIMNLALGITGILCCWFKGYFWLATAIFSIVIMIGCGVGHLKEVLVKQNKAPYNAGFGIWLQTVILPVIMVILVSMYFTLR